MEDLRLHADIEPDMKDALLVVAFPSTGSASSIAAQYLQKNIDLPWVGDLRGGPLPPMVSVQDGIATAPLRLYGGEMVCALDNCPSLYLLTTDLALPNEIAEDVAVAVAQLAKSQGVKMVLCLDSVSRKEGDDTPDVWAVAAQKEVLKELQKIGLEQLPRAMLLGVTGALLLEARNQGVHVGALVVEALDDIPDGRAAAALIQALDKLIPEIVVDHKPLLEEAMELESAINRARQTAEPKPSRHGTFI